MEMKFFSAGVYITCRKLGSLGSSTHKIFVVQFFFIAANPVQLILKTLQLFGRDMIWRQRVTSIILLAMFNLLPSLAPFCNKSHYYREICVTANSVLNSFSFWAQTRFLRRPQMEKYISKKIYSTSSAKCPVLLSWSYAVAQRLYSYMFSWLCRMIFVVKSSFLTIETLLANGVSSMDTMMGFWRNEQEKQLKP